MLHNLNSLKVQKSMKNCRFLKIGILRLTAHQIIGLKQTNNKFRCFSEVHQPNICILAILFTWKCVLLNFIYWLIFQKWVGGDPGPPAPSPVKALSPLLSTCKEPILFKRPAPIMDTLFMSRGCLLSRASIVLTSEK